jgi:hypothetical protein
LPEFEKLGFNFSDERCNPADVLLDAVRSHTWKVRLFSLPIYIQLDL